MATLIPIQGIMRHSRSGTVPAWVWSLLEAIIGATYRRFIVGVTYTSPVKGLERGL